MKGFCRVPRTADCITGYNEDRSPRLHTMQSQLKTEELLDKATPVHFSSHVLRK